MNNTVRNMALTVAVIAIVASLSGFANPMGTGEQGRPQMGASFLQTYVASGVISQDELEAIEAYMQSKMEAMGSQKPDTNAANMGEKGSLSNDLVNQGLLTSSQAAQIEWPEVPQQMGEKPAVDEAPKAIDGITVTVNGMPVVSDVSPYVDGNNRTLIELRSVAEALGAEISWDGSTQTVSLELSDETVEIIIGNAVYRKNGSNKTMDTAAVIQDGRTMVPVRVVAEALGADVTWDATTQTVAITF